MIVDWLAVIISIVALLISGIGYLITNKYSKYPNRENVRQNIIDLLKGYEICNGYNGLFGIDKTKNVSPLNEESVLRETLMFFGKGTKDLLVKTIAAGKEYQKVDGYFNEYDYILRLSDFDNNDLIRISSSDEYEQKEIEEYYDSIEEYPIPGLEDFSLDKYNLNDLISKSNSKNTIFINCREELLTDINKKIVSMRL